MRVLRTVPLLLAAIPGCTTYQGEHHLGRGDIELARVERADGSIETYVLEIGASPAHASLRMVTERDRERAFLGLRVMEIDRQQAERRGVAPWSGLLVTGTYPQSAAERAGLLPGDILLSVAGESTVYAEHVPKVELRLRPGQQVDATVLRGGGRLVLPVEAAALRERIVDPQSVPLEAPEPAERAYAGVLLRGIPRVWSERIYGDERNAVVIAGVSVGSPAWRAGLRGGDLIEAVDGRPCPDVRELAHEIAARGPAGGTMVVRVVRGDERHEGSVRLEDYLGTRELWVPLVFHVRDGAAEDAWSVGPFGLLLSNRHSYVPDTSTRELQTKNEFSALFGLFHRESGPRERQLRLLWFLRIGL